MSNDNKGRRLETINICMMLALAVVVVLLTMV